MSDSQGDQRALIDALDRFTAQADKVLSLNSGNTSNAIHVNAGGIGVWACLTACAVSMVLCAVMAVMFLDMNRKYDRTQDLLSVIYQQAPWLKPPSEKKE